MNKPAHYNSQSTREVAAFLDSAGSNIESGDKHAILDSVRNKSGVTVPKQLDELLGKLTEKDSGKVLDGIQIGIAEFTQEHGSSPTADVVEAAIQQGSTAFLGIDGSGRVLDSATSLNHDALSLQPNRAVVAILAAIAEAIPFAAYLPVDIQSNQGKLAILSHAAGSTFGDFTAGKIMDGVNAGDAYTSSARFVRFGAFAGTGPYTASSKFTQTNLSNDAGYCDAAGTGVPLLKGRAVVYVNGMVAATESPSGGTLAGSIAVGGTAYSVTGTVNNTSGAISLSVTGGDPAALEVTAQAFIDYETAPALAPKVQVVANVYDIYANPWRVLTGISVDSSSQLRNELGLDGNSEALMAIRTQMAMERHYQAMRMAYALGKNNEVAYNFDYTAQIAQKTRAQIWQDFQSVISNADQKMANATMDHGITHLYVPAFIAAQMASLPAELFQPSGIAARPGIYRVGRLFGKYEVYYSPKVCAQASDLTTASILAVGRSTQVARCPIVLGDAVAPTFLPLATGSDMNQNSAMYARDFTVVNPHAPSALGCARINITNLF